MYDVVLNNLLMSKVCIHFGTHKHHVVKDECKDAIVQIKNEIKAQIERMSNAKVSTISIAIN